MNKLDELIPYAKKYNMTIDGVIEKIKELTNEAEDIEKNDLYQ